MEKEKKAKSSTKTVKSSSKKGTSKVTASKQVESNESYSSKYILTEASVSSKSTRKTASTSKKASSSKRTTKTSSTKTTRKTTTSRSTTRKKKLSADEITSTTNLTQKIEVIEYYDLPYRYNQTVVRVLAQTPTTLFIYWDISDIDRANDNAMPGIGLKCDLNAFIYSSSLFALFKMFEIRAEVSISDS